MVHNAKVYLYVGHDEAKAHENHYVLNEWLIFSSDDMVNWTEEAAFPASAFEWAKGEAWAAHVVEKEGKFYWYVTVEHGTIPGKSIGVAVSDSPTGPFKDALGKALITNDMTTEHSDSYWDDIDPAVFIDDDGEAYMYWGNVVCYWVRLNDNMIELDGPIQTVDLPHFTEAPYIHKKDEWYYLTYAYMFPERTAYARSKSVTGPWEFKGLLNEVAGNTNTNHQSIIEFKGKDYFIYHNGVIPTAGGSYRRSVCVDYLYYKEDGTMQKVLMTSEGVAPAR